MPAPTAHGARNVTVVRDEERALRVLELGGVDRRLVRPAIALDVLGLHPLDEGDAVRVVEPATEDRKRSWVGLHS